ncbi:MAG: dicarboxylate/amino acid:cation symporter [Proteobacteria bacterium]|nr:dicarboxylate/amino acid:cation symporter [Pseudomonadota bacterium]MDA1302423.1 dicarboxylate/amino acid:cation symporter [Pseudomonadota bacterium]
MLNNVTLQVLLAAILGVVLALALGDSAWLDEPGVVYQAVLLLKSMFLAALRMLIAPLIFFSLIGGICGIGNVIRLRALGGITVIYYLCTTSIAILLGLFVVFFVHPWTQYPPVMEVGELAPGRLLDPNSGPMSGVMGSLASQLLTNPFTALTELNILGIVANAFLIGLAMVLALPQDSPVFTVVNHINLVISRVLGWIIRLLPIGIFAILFDFTIKLSADTGHGQAFLTQLLQFGGVVVLLTLIHGLVVLPGIATLMTGMNPVTLLRKIARPMLVAFSTSSSSATLPVSMRTASEELEVSESVSSFVLPLGATMNMDGTALFEALAAVFLAYLYGIELTNVLIVTIFLMSMVASIGAPGMPSASMAGMQMVLIAVGIPLEAIAILLVIERPLDTIRTAVNVEGDLVGSLVVQSRLR